jgi:hypothetical protein
VRRADRLFEIVRSLRGRRLTTARQLTQWPEVSERTTIYCHVADLLTSGVPIDGEAGAGYRIKPGFNLPPQMFNVNEIEALVIGARVVESRGRPGLAQACAPLAVRRIEDFLRRVPSEKRTAVARSVPWASGRGGASDAAGHVGERLRHRIGDAALLIVAFLGRQVEGVVDVVADVARRQPVQCNAGDVGQQPWIDRLAAFARDTQHLVEHQALVVVVDRIETGATHDRPCARLAAASAT